MLQTLLIFEYDTPFNLIDRFVWFLCPRFMAEEKLQN